MSPLFSMSLDDKQEIDQQQLQEASAEFAQFASYMKQPGQDLPAPGSNPTVTPQPAERAFPAQPPKGDAQGSAPEVATRPIPGRCLSFLLALQLRRPTKGPRGGAQGQGVPEVLPEDADTSPADPPLQGGRAKEVEMSSSSRTASASLPATQEWATLRRRRGVRPTLPRKWKRSRKPPHKQRVANTPGWSWSRRPRLRPGRLS